MVRQAALLFGIVLTLIGLLGFVPALAPDDKLLGIFEVDTLHNLVHLASGLVALGAWVAGSGAAKLYFQAFGIVYGLVAVIGFIQGDTVLGLILVNLADNLLHVLITAAALYLGFVATDRVVTDSTTTAA